MHVISNYCPLYIFYPCQKREQQKNIIIHLCMIHLCEWPILFSFIFCYSLLCLCNLFQSISLFLLKKWLLCFLYANRKLKVNYSTGVIKTWLDKRVHNEKEQKNVLVLQPPIKPCELKFNQIHRCLFRHIKP